MTVGRRIVFCAVALMLAALTLSAVNALPTYSPGAGQQQFIYTFVTPGAIGRISESETADFNCDNRPDVILSNGAFQSGLNWPITIALSNGSGGYIDGTAQIFGGSPVAKSEHLGKILIEDFNGDGRSDIFIADSGIDGAPFTGRQNTLILSTPDCHLVDATANLPQQSDFTHSATTGDVDGDGDVDIYVGNIWGSHVPPYPPQIWLNDGTGHFTIASGMLPVAQTNLNENRYTTSLFVDVDNDYDVDLVLGQDNTNTALESAVLINDGAGHFSRLGNALPAKPFANESPGDATSKSNGLPMDVKSTDFDHDGFADLAFEFTRWNPYYKGRWIQLLRNNQNGTFTDETATRLFPANSTSTLLDWLLFVHFVDLDGDGNQDLIGQLIGSNTGDSHRFYLASNSGVFTETPFLAGLFDVFALVDARGDGHRDVLTTSNIGNDQHRVSLLSDTGPVLPPGIPQKVRASTNSGGHVRLFWPYVWGASSYQVWRSSTPGGVESLVAPAVSTTSYEDIALAAGATAYYTIRAVNSVGTSGSSQQVRALPPPATPTFPLPTFGSPQTQFTYSQPGRIPEAETGDFNCDNRPDVVFTNNLFNNASGTQAINIALSNGSGGYVDGASQIFGGAAVPRTEQDRKILVEDFNGDGRADIFIADMGFTSGSFPGRQNILILSTASCQMVNASANLPQQSDSTNSATAGDVDGDGDADIYVGNVWGGNLIPPQIWLNDGTAHFTVASGLLPAAQTDLDQNRYTASLFVDVDNDYDVDLVLGGDNGKPTASIVLLNDGTGHFSLLPNAMPPKPFSPSAWAIDIKAADFNHDGFADLAVAYMKSSFQGRWIQLLKNNGNGTFTDESAARLSPAQTDNVLKYLWSVHFVDLEGDGNHDLIGQLIDVNSDSHRFYQANNSGVFAERSILAGQLGDVFALVDARGDGHRDVLNTSNIGNDQHEVSLLSNSGSVQPPGVPLRLRASRNLSGHVRLWWPYVWGATSYQVWRSSTPGSAGSLVTTVSTTGVEDASATVGSTVYYRIRAVNSAGTSDYSTQVRALPLFPPSVVTGAATNLSFSGTATAATFNATVNPNGNSTTVVFQYDDLFGYRFTTPVSAAPGTGNSPVAVSATVTGLGCGIAHHFRPVATNAGGTTTGAETVFKTVACPTLSALPTGVTLKPQDPPPTMRFAATKNGANGALVNVTPGQLVSVLVASGVQSWTASADKTWIGLTNASGTGSGQMTVTIINPGNTLGGSTSATGKITVTSGTLTATVNVNLTVDLSGGTVPKGTTIGSFDTPSNNATGLSGAIGVTGWALDTFGVQKVQIWRNCVIGIDRPANAAGACAASVPNGAANFVYIGDAAFLPGARSDLETDSGTSTMPQNYKGGWGYLMSTNALPHLPNGPATGGQGTFTLTAIAVNIEGKYTTLGTKTITIDNDGATIPFGSIDTPDQGGLVTSSVFANFGWAMTQNPKCIDANSTTAYKVYIDGVSLPLTPGVNWFPGLTRPDIEAAYPGRCDSTDALAAYYIDATALGLSNGLHTTGWDIIDSQGKIAGIGSRFFNVLIGSSVISDVVSGFSRTQTDAADVRLKADTTSEIGDRPIALGSATSLAALASALRPVRVRIGSDDAPFVVATPDASGQYRVQFATGGRISLDFSGPMEAGYLQVGDELRGLPAGSTLDAAAGQFFWQPPVPFFGPFELVFVSGNERVEVQATIIDPTAAALIAMHIDTPASGTTVDGSVVVAGWALDPHAATGSGIDTLHVWAYRRDGVAAPQFLGAAAVGGARPDVAAIHGDQFDAAGFSLTTSTLAPGVYDLVVYPWSHRTGRFEEATSVRVVVR